MAAMEWAELDLEAGVWSIPKERAKNSVAHEVQLSREAIEILSALPRIAGALVFTTNGKTSVSGFSRAKERIDAIMTARAGRAIDPWILHDLAQNGDDRNGGAENSAACRRPHLEPHVRHVRGVAAVYNRHQYGEERRDALAAWGRAVEAIVSGRPATNVVTLVQSRSAS